MLSPAPRLRPRRVGFVTRVHCAGVTSDSAEQSGAEAGVNSCHDPVGRVHPAVSRGQAGAARARAAERALDVRGRPVERESVGLLAAGGRAGGRPSRSSQQWSSR